MATRWMAVAGMALLACRASGTAGAEEATLRSGPQPGERPLPFTSNQVTGAHRGKQYCYICELKDQPAVLVFARSADPATARLLRGLRDAIRERRGERLFGWMVLLSGADTESQTALERRAFQLARENGATTVPLSVLGDPQGPPGYLIAPEAEVTVILFRAGKTLYNRAYRSAEWNEKEAESALKMLPTYLNPAS